MIWWASTLLVALIALQGAPASAQMLCGARDNLVKQITGKYGETRRGLGFANGRSIFEIYSSEETGTWTILRSNPNNRACMIAAGQNWQDDPPPDGTKL